MRRLSGLLAVVLLLGTGGQGVSAHQAAAPQATRPAPPSFSPEQVAAFGAFAALTTDDERAAFVLQAAALQTATAAADFSLWLSTARLPAPARVAGYTSLEWLARRTGAQRQYVVAFTNRGAAFGALGRFDLAKSDLEHAYALVAPLNDNTLRASIVTSLATALGRLGDSDRALALFNESAELALANNDNIGLARALNNLGNFRFNRGDLRRAQEAYARSLSLSPDDGAAGTLARARVLGNIGNLYLDVGDDAQAIRYLDDALALWPKGDAAASPATLLSNLGLAHRSIDRDKAKSYLDRALETAEKHREAAVAAKALYNLGLLSFDARRWSDAMAFFRRSLELHEAGTYVSGIAECLTKMADVALEQGDPDLAEPYLQRARDLAQRAGVLPGVIRAQVGLAEVAELRKNSAGALALYQEAEQTLAVLSQQTIGSERTQQRYLTYRLAPYLGTAAVHATDGRFVEALLASERARARVLLSVLDSSTVALMSEAERQREEVLTADLALANIALENERAQQTPDAARIATLEAAVTRARLARESFRDDLFAAKPAVGLARGRATMATPAAMASVLPKATGAVLFVVEPARVWRYTVTGEGGELKVHVSKLPVDPTQLRLMAEQFATQIATRDLAFGASAKALRSMLFGGLDTWLDGLDHLVVVPDGVLWQVPFQALQDQAGRYLIERATVSYTPSLSALSVLTARRNSRPSGSKQLVALGNPATGNDMARLPEAEREVRAVGRLYGANASVVFTGAEATEEALRTHVREASVIHIATHGDLDNTAPMYSFLRLAATAPADTRRDGRLEAVEWMDLAMKADLVVLSACTTAGATSLSGEGLIGQTWALFAAGASSAVVSQWAVDSASTTDLMIAFHQKYRATGKAPGGPAAALRDAALSVMKDSRYRHPFYWAGFSVVGVQ